MAVRHYTFNLTTTATLLNIGTFDKHSTSPCTIVFNTNKNNNDTTMIGSSTVTDTNYGIHLDSDEQFVVSSVYNDGGAGFYARAKTTTSVLHVLVVD
jgi:hypothetical protein